MLNGSDMLAVREGKSSKVGRAVLLREKERLNLSTEITAGRYTLSRFPCCRNNLNLATIHV